MSLEKEDWTRKDGAFLRTYADVVANGSTMRAMATLCFSPTDALDRASKLRESKEQLGNFLIGADPARELPRHQLVLAIQELVKNTLDHSDERARLSLECASSEKGFESFRFLYEDFGPRTPVPPKHAGTILEQPSTKAGNGTNAGVGHAIVVASLSQLGMQLQVRDHGDDRPFEMRIEPTARFPLSRTHSLPLAFYAEKIRHS